MPLESDDLARLHDIENFGAKVAAIVAGVTRAQFVGDDKTLFATCYGIQVVGEAAWKLSGSFQRAHAEIPWALISSMRHRLVHDYGRADEAIIFQVATVQLPTLVRQVRAILAVDGR